MWYCMRGRYASSDNEPPLLGIMLNVVRWMGHCSYKWLCVHYITFTFLKILKFAMNCLFSPSRYFLVSPFNFFLCIRTSLLLWIIWIIFFPFFNISLSFFPLLLPLDKKTTEGNCIVLQVQLLTEYLFVFWFIIQNIQYVFRQ